MPLTHYPSNFQLTYKVVTISHKTKKLRTEEYLLHGCSCIAVLTSKVTFKPYWVVLLNFLVFQSTCTLQTLFCRADISRREQEGRSLGEKEWDAGEKRAGKQNSLGGGNREKTIKILRQFVIFHKRYGTKRIEPLLKGARSGKHGTGSRRKSREVQTPPVPHGQSSQYKGFSVFVLHYNSYCNVSFFIFLCRMAVWMHSTLHQPHT